MVTLAEELGFQIPATAYTKTCVAKAAADAAGCSAKPEEECKGPDCQVVPEFKNP